MIYHGSHDQALPYSESLRSVYPTDRDVADFLLDLGADEQYTATKQKENDVEVVMVYALVETPCNSTESAEFLMQLLLSTMVIKMVKRNEGHWRCQEAARKFATTFLECT